MSKYSLNDLINAEIDPALIEDAKIVLDGIYLKLESQSQIVVFPFYEAPTALRKVCCLNGGDEDWMIITFKEITPWVPRWIDKTDSCETPDEYTIGNVTIYVGSHA
jgi:hypothetical protein